MMTIEQAMALYLDIHRQPTGNLRADLITSGKVAQQWRTVGPEATAVIVCALHEEHGMTYREIQDATDIPDSSVGYMIRQLKTGALSKHRATPEGGRPE